MRIAIDFLAFIITGSMLCGQGSDRPLMRMSPGDILANDQRVLNAPRARLIKNIERHRGFLGATYSSPVFSLMDRLPYSPSSWNQGGCGNCWVWASTAVASINYGANTLFSVQYFNSNYVGSSGWACCGGFPGQFASFYNVGNQVSFVPWSNQNAQYTDGISRCGSNTATPSYLIDRSARFPYGWINTSVVPTSGVGQTGAIGNIKNILLQNKAVVLTYWLPDYAWNNFFTWWDNSPQSAVWSGINGHNGQWGGAGHCVAVVGFDDTDSSWICLNSWGPTPLRPGVLFKIPQMMDYDSRLAVSGGSYRQFVFETFDIPHVSIRATMTNPRQDDEYIGSGGYYCLTAEASSEDPNAVFSYRWTVRGQIYNGKEVYVSFPEYPTCIPESRARTYNIQLTVSDQFGNSTSQTRRVKSWGCPTT